MVAFPTSLVLALLSDLVDEDYLFFATLLGVSAIFLGMSSLLGLVAAAVTELDDEIK